MGSGSFTASAFACYNSSMGKSYDATSNRVVGQVYKAKTMDPELDPLNVTRECLNSEEHPNTVPVILALDVTGSMGSACKETAEALGVIVTDLYEKFKDIEIMIMGIGDLDYDRAPIQISQFESDVRIAKWLDKLFIEHGGGGNSFESYTAAWYMGLKHTKLDAFDKQGRKGIIITMGDEPMNPYLPKNQLSSVTGDNLQADIETDQLFKEAVEKFDIFHIAVNDSATSYSSYATRIKETFGKLLGERLKVSTINQLSSTIIDCIKEVIWGTGEAVPESNNSGISW